MSLSLSHWRSLKTRVTLLTLAIFLLGMTIVTFWTGHMLHEDMRVILERQQFSITAAAADEVNQELADRLHAIELVAGGITPALQTDLTALQLYLEQRPVLQAMFNAGTFITWRDGTAVASVPESYDRVGVNFMELIHLAPAMAHGKSSISPITLGKQLRAPVFVMTAPIRDPNGQAIGALVGVVNLGAPNFLDKITNSRYGTTGSYVLVARAQRLIVTGSDKRSVMQALPPPGVNNMADRFMAGFEGAGVGTTPAGEEVLVAAKSIPVANWYVATHLPTAEAFAPIYALQQRMWWAIALLTLLATTLTWWMLQRQLLPLVSTAATLAALPANSQFPVALPVTQDDEIGRLITGFNQLLHSLGQRDAALHDKQNQLNQLVHEQNAMLSNHMIGIVKVTRRIIQWANPAYLSMTGYRLDELVGQSTRLHYPSDAAYQTLASAAYPLLAAGKVFRAEIEFRHKDGAPLWVDLSGAMLEGTSEDTLWVCLDITEHLRTAQALKDSEARFRTLTEWTPEALAVHRNGKLLYVNPAAVRMFGAAKPQDLLGKPLLALVHPDCHPIVLERIQNCNPVASLPMIEEKFVKLDGSAFDVEVTAIAIQFDGEPAVQTAAHDITARKLAVAALQATLADKVALLNEVHHRVKNNLQVITSLLRLEAGRSSQPDTKTVLQDMQGRIRSMALLHETLYRSGIFATVELSAYLKQLATQAFRAQDNGTVRLQLALDTVHVSMDQATPCGLLVNELISNCLKHAFPSNQSGEIHLDLHAVAEPADPQNNDANPARAPQWCLCVSDTGVGLPADFEARRTQSLGLQLATDLAKQVGGTLTISTLPSPGTGASFSVVFSVESA